MYSYAIWTLVVQFAQVWLVKYYYVNKTGQHCHLTVLTHVNFVPSNIIIN